ncbi:rhamnogalacturonan acetylesterase [Paenibacillus methanolicus]|uniref:Lysophospholipase L1-like esterase n=1 Tax=Paenibacillus methanolicus TaxID=582686 RepID=A0A5S5CI08_9BACL|nr:rhamnogalacturonan acetylesterase [Paenibacillus methanolicus]TYP78248.1 lysophospholipase L1-like esterase [Paenibacillus methanolicus]
MIGLYLAGDSTAAQKGGAEKPMAGWGEFLPFRFQSGVAVRNWAINGRSTKSFIAEGRLAAIAREIAPGDYWFIQFGHNDGKTEDPSRYCDADDYQANLGRFVTAAREAGAVPVLLTPVSRRRFNPDGELDPLAVGSYPEAMREAAAELGVPLLDLFARSQRLYAETGVEASKSLFVHLAPGAHPNYPDGLTDDTHFSEQGARAIARLVAEEIRRHPALDALAARLLAE